ncbi:MAG: putative collagen-binding domain-containing protein, partial [Segetibacter sp.]
SLIKDAMGANDRIQATRGKDYLFVYSTQGKPITVNMGKIEGKEVISFWYNPKNGETKDGSRLPNTGQQTFTPPTTGYGNDWVLVIDDATKAYTKPFLK